MVTQERIASGLLLVTFLLASGPAFCSSLWPGATHSLYAAPPRTWQVGDLITVIIVEQAQATQTAGTETTKKSGVGVEVTASGLPGLDLWTALDAGIEGGDKLKTSGKTVRGGSLRATITVSVVELLGTDGLRIEGRQAIVLNGETQEIVLSGVIRAKDVQPDNTVLSTYLADSAIAYKGAGVLGAKQQQGVLTRFFHWLF